jgi:hypothetical protein
MTNATLLPEPQEVYSHWLRVMSSAFRGQWRLLDAQYQAGLDFLKTFAEAREIKAGARQESKAPPAAVSAEFGDLEARALERVRKGFPPPREVYLAQNRNRIDWSRFPEWAWPTDPEAFTETAHEG